MKKPGIVFFLFMIATHLFSQDSKNTVSGKVTAANQEALSGVHIIIKETNQGTYTDAYGKYSLLTKPGDVLLFSYLGMQTVEVRVEKSPSTINVIMEASSIDLNSLEIKARRRPKSQKDLLEEYPRNKKLIKTSWGILDKDRSSARMRIIDGTDLINVGTDFLYSLQTHIPQMQVDRSDGIMVYLQRMSYSSDPQVIFDVDGIIYVVAPIHLSANDIDRVAILEHNAAISKYGQQGAGGAIIINTKAQNTMDDIGVKRKYDNRGLVDSLIKEVARPEVYSPYKSSPIGKIQEAKTEKQALAQYAAERKKYRKNPYYFLEVYDYFSSQWENAEQAEELVQHISKHFKKDVLALKALAYLAQQYGRYDSALSLYLQILEGQYDKVQSHRDVANAYVEVGDFEKGLKVYTKYANEICQLPHPPFDAYGEDLLITTEMKNILAQNKAFFLDNYDIKSTANTSDTLTRLVFEWNNPKAEFEIHLINPEGNVDTWANTKSQAGSRNSAVVQGYSSKQFLVAKENKGSWQLNIDYKGNRSEIPTYLKVSVYQDYGLDSQQTKINVYKLTKTQRKVHLFVL